MFTPDNFLWWEINVTWQLSKWCFRKGGSTAFPLERPVTAPERSSYQVTPFFVPVPGERSRTLLSFPLPFNVALQEMMTCLQDNQSDAAPSLLKCQRWWGTPEKSYIVTTINSILFVNLISCEANPQSKPRLPFDCTAVKRIFQVTSPSCALIPSKASYHLMSEWLRPQRLFPQTQHQRTEHKLPTKKGMRRNLLTLNQHSNSRRGRWWSTAQPNILEIKFQPRRVPICGRIPLCSR